ncbi:MAG: hypothetical protein AB7O68_09300 [Pirellulales bacterium]
MQRVAAFLGAQKKSRIDGAGIDAASVTRRAAGNASENIQCQQSRQFLLQFRQHRDRVWAFSNESRQCAWSRRKKKKRLVGGAETGQPDARARWHAHLQTTTPACVARKHSFVLLN